MSSHDEREQGIAAATQAREELYGTLAQLKEQLNYAKRFDRAVDRAKARIAETKKSSPLVFAAGVAATATAAGLVVWGVTMKVIDLFDDE